MRAVALLMVLATSAAADPPPLPSASLRNARSSPFVIGPSNLKSRPVAGKDIETLRRRAAIARGLERVDVLDDLTSLLENQDVPDDQLERLFQETTAWYVILLKEPALEKSSRADEILVRGAKSVQGREPELAQQSLERVIAKYPRSPYLADAHVLLAETAERKQAYADAAKHLRAVIAMHDKMFAAYARLRLGWLLSLAGDAKGAVAELAQVVIDGEEPSLVEIALDVIAVPYAQVGRAELAAALYDRGDRSETASRLRRLASEYSDKGKLAEANTVLRAAIAHDSDPTAICLDRADIVYVTSQGKNKVDLALAIAELAEARKLADSTCMLAADVALARAKRSTR